MNSLFRNVVMCALVAGFVGCQSKPKPEKIVFLKRPDLLKKYKVVPFQKAWKAKGVNLRRYNKVIVEPVILSQKLSKNELENLNLDSVLGTEKKAILEFARYTQKAFQRAIRKDPRLKLVTKPGPNTLIIKLALVKVVPGKPLLGIVRNAPLPIGQAGFIVTPIIKVAGGTIGSLKSSVAIEGEFIDSQTRKIVAMFADKETEKTALINFNLMTTFGTPKEIVDQWAELVVKCLNRKPNQKIKAPSRLKLINY